MDRTHRLFDRPEMSNLVSRLSLVRSCPSWRRGPARVLRIGNGVSISEVALGLSGFEDRHLDDATRQRSAGCPGVSYNHLVANLLSFHTLVTMTKALQQLLEEGHTVDMQALSTLSPYRTEHIKRGRYKLPTLSHPRLAEQLPKYISHAFGSLDKTLETRLPPQRLRRHLLPPLQT
jgi:hypothetical protein